MTHDSKWRALGERAGILPEYHNYDATQRVVTSDATYKAILESLGYDENAPGGSATHVPAHLSEPPAARCISCREKSNKRQLRGIWVNLYSIRSQTNWGIGDFGDLRRIVQWAGTMGLDFFAMNPLHALRNREDDVSPYRPVSRLYRNEIYIEIEAVPEFNACRPLQAWMESSEFRVATEACRVVDMIDYDAARALKRNALRFLYETFLQIHERPDSPRRREYEAYLSSEGTSLRDFATFVALDEGNTARSGAPPEWPHWTDGLANALGAKVARYQAEQAREIDFHCFVQFELDRQLAAIARLATDSGMAVGLMGDLAIGTSPDGSDPWAFPDLFVNGVSIGAPPDDLGPTGQNWSLPPMNPRVLVESDFAYWRKLLQNNMAYMGALRIDHVMGLLRQFWIPDGFDGSMGAYMQFPAEQLFSILAEESRKSQCIVVGEDLGTVPGGFRDLLQRFGVLSTRVVRFEREWDGGFRPSVSYPHNAYVVVGTHDMAPLAGYRLGTDLRLRAELDQWPDSKLQEALNHRNSEWHALQTRLKEEGFGVDNSSQQPQAVQVALNGFLAKLPSCMVAASLDDVAGEIEAVNVPGFGQDKHRSWSRRMTMPLESIIESETIKQSLASWAMP